MTATALPDAPPQDLAAERAVLGAMMLDERGLDLGAQMDPAAFYRVTHGKIWRALVALRCNGAPDLVSLADELRKRGELEAVGGPSYLASLYEYATTSANVEQHMRIVQAKAALRAVQDVARKLLQSTTDPGANPETLSTQAGTHLRDIARGTGQVTLSHSLERYVAPARTDEFPAPLLGDGLVCAGDLVLIAGKPGLGKSRIAVELSVSLSHARTFLGLDTPARPIRVGYIAAEFTRYRFWQRTVQLLTGEAPPEDPTELQAAFNALRTDLDVITGDVLHEPLDLLSERSVRQLEELIEERSLEHLVLDPLARMMGGRDETNEFFGPVVNALDRIRFRTRCTILVVHHERKGSTDPRATQDDLEAIRGGMKLVDGSNTVMRLSATHGGLVRLSFPKCNYAKKPDPLWLRIPDNGGPTDVERSPEDTLDTNRMRVMAVLNGSPEVTFTAQMVTTQLAGAISKKTVQRHLQALADAGQITRQAGQGRRDFYRAGGGVSNPELLEKLEDDGWVGQ